MVLDLWIFSKAAELISSTDKFISAGLIFLAFTYNIIFSFGSNSAVAGWDITQGAAYSNSCHAQRAFSWDGMPFVVTHHLFKHLPEAGGHKVVENRINC